MNTISRRRLGSVLLSVISSVYFFASGIKAFGADVGAIQPPVWSINMFQMPGNGNLYCQARMSGMNPAAGGYYEIMWRHYFLTVVHDGPDIPVDANVSVFVDDVLLFHANKIVQVKWGEHRAVLFDAPDAEAFLGSIEKQDAKILSVQFAGKSYSSIIGNLHKEREFMGNCYKDLMTKKAKEWDGIVNAAMSESAKNNNGQALIKKNCDKSGFCTSLIRVDENGRQSKLIATITKASNGDVVKRDECSYPNVNPEIGVCKNFDTGAIVKTYKTVTGLWAISHD